MQGLHNAANAMAALAMCEALRLPDRTGARSAGKLRRPAASLAVGCGRRGVHYVNDSKGTNVGATLAAVAGMSGPLIVIAGGDGKNQDFTALRAAFRGKVRRVVLIGRDAASLEQALRRRLRNRACRATWSTPCVPPRNAAQPGDTVLLSPACASLDMFRDYTHRGDEFVAAVRDLA